MPAYGPRKWLRIDASGGRDRKDEAVALLIEAGSPGVQEETSTASSGRLVSFSRWTEAADEPDDGPDHAAASLTAYMDVEDPGKIEGVKKALKAIGWVCAVSAYRDRDWSVKWKSRLKVIRVNSPRGAVVVRPTWLKVERRPGDAVVSIDPGMAFGTGGHATTKMCLKAILMVLTKPGLVKASTASLLDVGTGSGVLAIAARKLGVKKAVAIDIDPMALAVARENARLNRAGVVISRGRLDGIKGRFSVVVANILAGDLIRLSPGLFAKTRPGGFIILSGVLSAEGDRVAGAFQSLGLRLFKRYSSGEWTALVFERAL